MRNSNVQVVLICGMLMFAQWLGLVVAYSLTGLNLLVTDWPLTAAFGWPPGERPQPIGQLWTMG